MAPTMTTGLRQLMVRSTGDQLGTPTFSVQSLVRSVRLVRFRGEMLEWGMQEDWIHCGEMGQDD